MPADTLQRAAVMEDGDEHTPLIQAAKPEAGVTRAPSHESSRGGAIVFALLLIVFVVLAAVGGSRVFGVGILSNDDSQKGGGTLLALLDGEGLAMQLKALQCHVMLGKALGMTVAVGPFKSAHYGSHEQAVRLSQFVKQEAGAPYFISVLTPSSPLTATVIKTTASYTYPKAS